MLGDMSLGRKIAVPMSAVLMGFALANVTLAPADAATRPVWTKNCTELNKKFPHGVGKTTAHDHVSSGTPVTNFKKSNTLFATAMSWNRGLDRDGDKIACEKH